MVITAHAVVGSLIACLFHKFARVKINNFWLWAIVFVFAFFSHFLLDAIPHWDYSLERPDQFSGLSRAVIDCLIAGLLIILSSRNLTKGFFGLWQCRILFWGAWAAILPDAIIYITKHLGMQTFLFLNFFKFHEGMHSSARPNLSYGGPIQIVIVIIACGLLWELYRKGGE